MIEPINWSENDGNYFYDTTIDGVSLQFQFNKIRNDDWLYVVYVKGQTTLTDKMVDDIKNMIDANDSPVEFEKVLLTSNNSKMITALYQYTEDDSKYQKSISYINGRPYPCLINDDIGRITESMAFRLLSLFEARKIKDNLITVIYYTKKGDVKFQNFTYDFDNQTYKCFVDPKIPEDELKDAIDQFIKDKQPNTLIFDKQLNKKLELFMNKKEFELKNDKFIFTGEIVLGDD